MQATEIIKAIKKLPLSKKFYVVEETLKEIKKEEMNRQLNFVSEKPFDGYMNSNDLLTIGEKSFAKDWLTDEDSRWDNLL